MVPCCQVALARLQALVQRQPLLLLLLQIRVLKHNSATPHLCDNQFRQGLPMWAEPGCSSLQMLP
jgi:hypothetical protein